MANFRVLENDIVLEDIWALARGIGFSGIEIQPMVDSSYALSMNGYRSLVRWGVVGSGGRDALMNGTDSLSVFFLQKGEFSYDSRYPAHLSASIDVRSSTGISCRNTGRARWLARAADGTDFGVVKLGVMKCDESGAIAERDWIRIPLPHDVESGGSVEISYELPIPHHQSLITRVDLVSEQVKWFGATTPPIAVRVSP